MKVYVDSISFMMIIESNSRVIYRFQQTSADRMPYKKTMLMFRNQFVTERVVNKVGIDDTLQYTTASTSER